MHGDFMADRRFGEGVRAAKPNWQRCEQAPAGCVPDANVDVLYRYCRCVRAPSNDTRIELR